MATYRKERNNLFIHLDNTSGEYRLDVNTGIFYGIKGMPIKAIPHKPNLEHLMYDYYGNIANYTNLTYAIHIICSNSTQTSSFARNQKYLENSDKLDALGLECCRLRDYQVEYLVENIRFLSAWLKEGNRFEYCDFQEACNWAEAKKKLGSVGELITPRMYNTLKRYDENWSVEEWDVIAYYLVRGKMWEYTNGNVARLVEYFSICKSMNKKPQKVNNFMREFVETKTTYELKKTEFDNNRIANNYAKYGKAWEFAYGNFVVSIPKCGQDLVDEGDRMHHCVGSYVSNIINGTSFICFIRHKDTPDKCYITCEVNRKGEISQYYLAYDRTISSEEDREFRTAFANHLKEVWGK